MTDFSNASRTLLFDIRKRAGTPTCASCSACRRQPARAAPERRGLRRDSGVRRLGPGGRDRRRPAGRAVRAGLPRARARQEHLRHRQLRAPERGRRAARALRGPAHHGRLGSGRAGRLRARGRDLRDRRGGPVAARRPRDHRRRRRDRAARPLARLQRRRLPRAGLHRPRVAALGSVRARDDRRAHARHRPRPPRPRRARGDGLPDGRRAARDGGGLGRGAGGAQGRRRRRGQRLADEVPGRRARRAGGRARGLGDDGAGGGVPRRASPRAPGPRRTCGRCGVRRRATSRRCPRTSARGAAGGLERALARAASNEAERTG